MMSDEAKIITDELKKIEENLADIQLILENETNKNIRLIAEGRFDRSRKPDGALKAKKEMLLLQMDRLEKDIRRIKQKIEEIASKDV
ncbi:hypothetical protein [Acetatifactor muris]|uniref:hypothetical protein n=1 Tax=Acetatifactor muris TaxID=879566 RepID=UPI001368BAA1|nr:hypothetical protein [Acetatifactor muris]